MDFQESGGAGGGRIVFRMQVCWTAYWRCIFVVVIDVAVVKVVIIVVLFCPETTGISVRQTGASSGGKKRLLHSGSHQLYGRNHTRISPLI
jgi:hypothetical protein